MEIILHLISQFDIVFVFLYGSMCRTNGTAPFERIPGSADYGMRKMGASRK